MLVLVGFFFLAMPIKAAIYNDGIQTYQKNLHLYEEHKQRLADDIVRYHNADNLWDVLREEFSLPHYENHPAVQEKIYWYLSNQDYLARSASRAAPYLYYILQQVKKRHLPAELVLLPVIESGYDPFSLSNMGAAGIWQLMPGTASGFGVKRNGWYDGRRDIIASTRAALSYLGYLQSFFEGNWLYAIAAYNTGEGNVLSAIKKNVRNGYNTDFWSLPVARETKDYVPSLLALAIIISNPDRYPVYLPPVRNAPYLAQIDLEKGIDLKYAATLAGITHKKLMQLNSGYTQNKNHEANKIILPIENVRQFSENFSQSPSAKHSINWQRYRVKPGDTLGSIANKFDVSVSELRKLNQLSNNSVKKGMNIVIPGNTINNDSYTTEDDDPERDANRNEFIANKKNNERPLIGKSRMPQPNKLKDVQMIAGNKYKLQPGDTIYMVRKEDTLSSIATRFKVSELALLSSNQLTDHKLQPGRQIIIPTNLESKSKNDEQKIKIQPNDTIYMVRTGETIEKISKKFHTTASAIRVANLLKSNTVREGDKLLIPTSFRG